MVQITNDEKIGAIAEHDKRNIGKNEFHPAGKGSLVSRSYPSGSANIIVKVFDSLNNIWYNLNGAISA